MAITIYGRQASTYWTRFNSHTNRTMNLHRQKQLITVHCQSERILSAHRRLLYPHRPRHQLTIHRAMNTQAIQAYRIKIIIITSETVKTCRLQKQHTPPIMDMDWIFWPQ